jgi:hypothetical protein
MASEPHVLTSPPLFLKPSLPVFMWKKKGAQFVIFWNNLLWSTSCVKCTTSPPYSQGTCAVDLWNFLPPLSPLTLTSFSSVPLNVMLPWFLDLDTPTKSVNVASTAKFCFRPRTDNVRTTAWVLRLSKESFVCFPFVLLQVHVDLSCTVSCLHVYTNTTLKLSIIIH